MTHQQEHTHTDTQVQPAQEAPKILRLFLEEPQTEEQEVERKPAAPDRRVTWTEDTIDNEGMGKLKSNLCCIYHRPGDSSSDTCTSDDEGNALERDRESKKNHKLVCSKFGNSKEKRDTKENEK